MKLSKILAAAFFWAAVFANSALAHTAGISSGRILPEADDQYRVDVGVLGADIERMFQEAQSERGDVDLSPPGVLEQEIGKFFERRVQLRNAEGELCKSRIVSVGEDPTNPYDAQIVLRFDCKGVAGRIFYDPGRLLRTQGPRGKHLVGIGEARGQGRLTEAQRMGAEPAPGQVMIFPSDGAVDLSKPLLAPWEMAPKFFIAGVERITTGYDHLCFLIAVMLWATRVWPAAKIVVAFAVSHSIALWLAALQLVNLPNRWVEIAIALSVIYVAAENFFTRNEDGRWRDTFVFGFAHGFGFAISLIEIGAPQRALGPAIASFNIGVEVGQIGVALVVLSLLLAIDRIFAKGRRSPRLVQVCSAAIACFGAYWLLVRAGVIS